MGAGWRGFEGRDPADGGILGSGDKARAALGDFCNFSIKITHFYAYFRQNSYFKAITHQLKAIEKQSKRTKYRINEVHVL